MATVVPVPIRGVVHWDDIRTEWRVKASREDPQTGAPFSVNELIELIEKAVTLLEVISILVDFFQGAAPTSGEVDPSAVIGDWQKFAKWAATRAGGTYSPPS
jgi:hypothetical protein